MEKKDDSDETDERHGKSEKFLNFLENLMGTWET
jgi:predicted alpha/beta superfamily hydrolase